MRLQISQSLVRTAAIAIPALFTGHAALAQSATVSLVAERMTATLPDGHVVKMWGYCQAAPTNTCARTTSTTTDPTTGVATTVTSLVTDGTAAWAPGPTIVVPTDANGFGSLTINLSNSLPVSTSIVILGQIGAQTGNGGTGTDVPRVTFPDHGTQGQISWPAQDPSAAFTPPGQQPRAVAFAAETPAGNTAPQSYTWAKLRPGTYLYETGSLPSLQAPMGLYGVLVVTQAPNGAAGEAYPKLGASAARLAYDADATLLFSEIDPRQNAAVDAAALDGASVTKLFNDASCQPTGALHCYPPVVNYAPTYFLVNGQAFNPTSPTASGITFSDNKVYSGNVLVRMVNAGLRMHVPTISGVKYVNLMAEDGNLAPGLPKKQSHLLMAAGKTYDVTFSPAQDAAASTPSYSLLTLPVFDRALSLTSGNLDSQTVLANSGMMAFLALQPAGTGIGATGGVAVPSALSALARDDFFATSPGAAFNGNVLANDVNVVNVAIKTGPTQGGTVSLAADGSFVYSPSATAAAGTTDTFTYCGNGCAAGSPTATVSVKIGSAQPPMAVADDGTTGAGPAFTSKVARLFKSGAPGVLGNDTAADGTAVGLTAELVSLGNCGSVELLADGSFTATAKTPGTACTFTYHAKNELGAVSNTAKAKVNFTAGSNLQVIVQDTQDKKPVLDYSWVIEEDTTFFHDPKTPTAVNTLATNFHRSSMPVLASGCTGPNSCGESNTFNGGATKVPYTATFPADVVLDPAKRYFISVLPGDADQGDATYADAKGNVDVVAYGHTMGGVPIPVRPTGQLTWPAATVLVPRNPLPPAQLSVIVFEDNNPTNGGVDDGEQGLGGFTINFYDTRGSSGDPAGLMTYDLSAMPFTNSLANQKDSATGENLCPLTGPSGTIITCPERTDRGSASPLAGMALVKNINPGRYDVWATPGADRAVKHEQWIQVSTLEGTHANDTFIKPGEPAYWQEFGPPGFHSFIGFINPAHIAAETNRERGRTTVTGRVPSLHMDRPRPTMANLNNSCATGVKADGSPVDPTDRTCRAILNSTPCYVAVNTNSGAGGNPTVGFTQCDDNGNFSIKNVPAGQHELVIWDQWLDQIIAYKALTVPTGATSVIAGDIPVFSWFTRVEQSAYQDLNGNGIRDANEPGVPQIPMNIRFRDGSISNFLATDSKGSVTANELFPLFNWYVLESDTTRYTGTGVFTTYDAGGKPDTAPVPVYDLTGAQSTTTPTMNYAGVLNSKESYPLANGLQVPNAVYTPGSTQRIDPGYTLTEGTQGYINQTAHLDWGKRPYVPGENGGITGMVYYASTRGFDDPSLEVQFSWEPGIANVPVNLYLEVKNTDGSVTRKLVDHTTTWSWDAATAQLNCPGEPDYDANNGANSDPFVNVTLAQSQVAKGKAPATAKTACYDGQHNFNQIQPTVYDGRYKFPTANCDPSVCKANPAIAALGLTGAAKAGTAQSVLPNGTYVVELVLPAGYEIVKEEDKNILIGDTYIAPFATTQFMGVGNIFIVPDQATLNDANVLGANLASAFPSCVGVDHLVPDSLTLFPDSGQFAPYAGQMRPLCDHKEVGVTDQGQGGADFQLFTRTPIAGHISGIMLNDAAAEFDPYNPAFLEKASLPNAPISVRDYNGVEIQRIYNDRYGTFNNLVPSTWEANIPNPSGYAPNMLTYCMNDPGPIVDPSGQIDPATNKVRLITDPLYNPMFSNFCYNWPSMPGITTYLDTPVLPVSAFASASSYEPVDCAYPASTPAIYRVDGTGTLADIKGVNHSNVGPFVDVRNNSTRQLVITALGNVQVPNPAYEGPNAVSITCPTGVACNQPNQPKITRHYGFGAFGAQSSVTIGSANIPVTAANWTDTKITVTVPASATSGELVITNAVGVKSIDTVTVTVANSSSGTYRRPWYVGPPAPGTSGADALGHPIQDVIDVARSGDLIIVDGGNYSELVVMDRPVRLQGVGAAATVINATKYPNQKTEQWRTRINNLFGLDNQGNALPGNAGSNPAVDPLPGQEITGGVVLLEPSVLSTEEGAGITVVAKNTNSCGNVHNFRCNPARIDGLSVTGGDAGGGIYVNGWAHGLEISNNRVYGNAGPFSGGVRIGQPYLEGQAITSNFNGLGYDENVLVHNNAITNNGTVEGNAAAGATAAAAGGAGGGLSICAGSDGYKVTGNWVCGNFSSSDGGGIGHIGLSNRGLIQGNKILFNESYNQTGAQFGGGLVIEGEGAAGGTLTFGTGNVTVDQNLIQGNFARAGSGGGIRLQSVNGAEIGTLRGNGHWSVTITNNMIVNNVAAWAGAGISLADTLYSNVVGNTIASNDSTGIAGNLFNTQVGTGNSGPTAAVPNPAGVASELTSPQLLAALASGDRAANVVSNPNLVNDIVWHNRSFFFNMDGGAPTTHLPQLSPSNKWSDATLASKPVLLAADPANGGCTSSDAYWDVGVVGDVSAATPGVFNALTVGIASATQAGGNNNRTVTVTTRVALGLPVGASITVTISGVTGSTVANRAFYNVTGAAATVTGTNTFTYRPSGAGVSNNTFGTLNFTAASAVIAGTGGAVIPLGNTLVSGSPGFVKAYCNGPRAVPGLQFEPGTPFQPAFNISVAATLDESGNFVDLHFGPLSLLDQASGTIVNGDYHLAAAAGDAYNAGGDPPAIVTPYGAHDFDGDARPAAGAFDKGADEFGSGAAVPPSFPALLVLDNFNRANGNTLGGNWRQLVALGAAGIRVIGNNAQCQGLLCAAGANAYWLTPAFGAKQAAALSFANNTLNGVGLVLEASGNFNALGFYPSAIRVRYQTGGTNQVIVETTSNGVQFTQNGALNATFASGDTMTALVGASGTVYVWKTSGGTSTFLGQAASTLTVTGGFIGVALPSGARVDDFAGGTVP